MLPYGEQLNIKVINLALYFAAQDYGWIWETPTWGRIGTGFVYCDDFLSVDDAENHMKKHWRSKGMILILINLLSLLVVLL